MIHKENLYDMSLEDEEGEEDEEDEEYYDCCLWLWRHHDGKDLRYDNLAIFHQFTVMCLDIN